MPVPPYSITFPERKRLQLLAAQMKYAADMNDWPQTQADWKRQVDRNMDCIELVEVRHHQETKERFGAAPEASAVPAENSPDSTMRS